MTLDPGEENLRRLHQQALAGRTGSGGDVPVETVHALAAGTYEGGDRLDLLDRVLGDPSLAAELDFFADIEREGRVKPSRAWRARPVPLLLAASFALLIGAG